MEDAARMEVAQQSRQSQRKFPVIRSPEHRVTAIRDNEISKAEIQIARRLSDVRAVLHMQPLKPLT